MKAVMLSVRPQWCELIANGQKTVEVRRNAPKLAIPFKCYIYQTKGSPAGWRRLDGKVIGEFVCDNIVGWGVNPLTGLYDVFPNELVQTCISSKDFEDYGGGKWLYGWHITDLKIYNRPKELSEFCKLCIMPEEPYCPCCEFGLELYPDDVETYADTQGNEYEQICTNRLKRAPQSWCYVEEAQS